MIVKLLTVPHLELLRLKKETVQACLSLHMSKRHIVGNHMSRLIYLRRRENTGFIRKPCLPWVGIYILTRSLPVPVPEWGLRSTSNTVTEIADV